MKLFTQQLWHMLLLSVLLYGLYFFFKSDTNMLQGALWGISTANWYLLAILPPILHQIYVLICWRSELHYKSLSKTFGGKAFEYYKGGFKVLILSRPVTIILLAISSTRTFNIAPILSYALVVICFLLFAYVIYSVVKYFGSDRVVGLDHFKPEEISKLPFIKQGVFKYSPNAMYLFGFLVLWIPGILFQSKAALLIALFNHLYIWVHYFFTELPDIKIIYTKTN